MNAAASFGRRDALDAVPADFVTEARNRGEFDRRGTVDNSVLVQSIDPVEEAGIGRGEVADEQAGVVAAFAGADFDDHDGFLKDMRKGMAGQRAAKVNFRAGYPSPSCGGLCQIRCLWSSGGVALPVNHS